MRFIVGIDEAGRGPLAGPVSVGAVAFPADFDRRLLRGIRDSKELSEAAREEWYARLRQWEREGLVRYIVQFSSARMIDRKGIAPSIRSAVSRALARLALAPEECEVLLDGSLYAPKAFSHQRTIIGGDASEPFISMAAIAAKVLRDRRMKNFAKKYPEYGFEVHKGYGTRKHYAALRENGLCIIHRKTFCRSVG